MASRLSDIIVVPDGLMGADAGAKHQRVSDRFGQLGGRSAYTIMSCTVVAATAVRRAVSGRGRVRSATRIPYKAVGNTLKGNQFDEILVSTLPHARSRWLRQDLPAKLKKFGLPVTHVVSN